jgi:hypothetical protein
MANHVLGQIGNDIKQEERHSSNQIAEIRARHAQIGVREREELKPLKGKTIEFLFL